HALFMLCHMAKHMIVTGFGLRQLCDFVLFTQANAEKIDWRIFWQETESLGLASFMRAVLEIGVRYLSLPDGAWTQGAPCADVDAAELLLADLLDAGVFGNRTQERERSAAVVYRAFNEQGDGWWHRIRRALFVTSDELRPPYLYAKRHRWLLPVAWIHRMGRYGAALLCGKRVHTELTEGMQIADARLGLLHRLGMREKKTKGMKENGL
ncbi:MAG: nucleotidyltransferase family protein, partial [Clostridia bacterium]